MEKFRLGIKNRSKKITLAASLIFLIYVYLSRKIGVPDAINDLAAGYNLGLLIALQVGAIYFITKYNKALKNKAQLKKQFYPLQIYQKFQQEFLWVNHLVFFFSRK